MTFTKEQLVNQAREEVDFWRERDELIPSQQTAIRLRLAEITLAALRAEPVAIVEPSDYVTAAQLVGECPARKAVHELYEGALRIGDKLYRHAPPAPISVPTFEEWCERNEQKPLGWVRDAMKEAYEGCRAAMLQGAEPRQAVRSEHAEWSQSTFGDVGPVGPLKHLSKEALEAAAEPGDLSEWADMQFLLWDAQRRAGITDEQITLAMIEKLAINKARDWPEPKDGEPRLHIKKAPQQEDPQIKK